MIETKVTSAIKQAPQDVIQLTRRISIKIGNTTYNVSVSFSQTSKENMNDKIIRLIRNEQQVTNQ